MRRAGVVGALSILTVALTNVDAEADWIHAHRRPLLALVFVALVLFFSVGAYAINALAPTSRSREVTHRAPAPVSRSLPRSGSRIHGRRHGRRGTRAYARSGSPITRGQWIAPRR